MPTNGDPRFDETAEIEIAGRRSMDDAGGRTRGMIEHDFENSLGARWNCANRRRAQIMISIVTIVLYAW